MKIVIDIPEEEYKRIIDGKWEGNPLADYIKNGELVIKEERPKDKWGKWVISEVRCPKCLEYFNTDCYSLSGLDICPNCGADMEVRNDNKV